jgi:NTP pyrophosphatase (non-canonical NTP hydrolase)
MERLVNLDNLAAELHETALEKGFWAPLDALRESDETFVFYAKQIAMIHSEATEVLEALRKDKGQAAVVEELADIIIRVLDLYNGLYNEGVVTSSLHKVLRKKAGVNKDRPRLHGVRG